MLYRDADLTLRISTAITPAEPKDGVYEAVIAVNDDVGDGSPINLRKMDLSAYLRNPVVLLGHARFGQEGIPIGRTRQLKWTDRGLMAFFEFLPNDPVAGRVRNAWDLGFLRTASIGARQKSGEPGKFELREWSIVPVPSDKDAVRALSCIIDDVLTPPSENDEMNEEQVRAIVEAALKGTSSDKGTQDAPALASAISRGLGDAISDAVKTALTNAEKQRAEEEAQRKAVEAAAQERIDKAVEAALERMGLKADDADGDGDNSDDDGSEGDRASDDMPFKKKRMPFKKKGMKKKAEDDEETMAEKAAKLAEERADLLVMVRDLLPEDFEARGASNHDILVAAAGEEVEDAEERSEDYLRAKIEDIVARRTAAEEAQRSSGGPQPKTTKPRAVIDVTRHLKRVS